LESEPEFKKKTNLGKNGLELGVEWQLTVPELELELSLISRI
jgi:hypothetical protein